MLKVLMNKLFFAFSARNTFSYCDKREKEEEKNGVRREKKRMV